jgi:hypothetical protein
MQAGLEVAPDDVAEEQLDAALALVDAVHAAEEVEDGEDDHGALKEAHHDLEGIGQGLVGGMPGAWGADVRNADGLIVISDMMSGFWAFKMDGFDGWNGHQWGMPNVSSAQDWDNGPDGLKKSKVS